MDDCTVKRYTGWINILMKIRTGYAKATSAIFRAEFSGKTAEDIALPILVALVELSEKNLDGFHALGFTDEDLVAYTQAVRAHAEQVAAVHAAIESADCYGTPDVSLT